jgi:hypothetical protein
MGTSDDRRCTVRRPEYDQASLLAEEGRPMDPIEDLRQRWTSASGRDAEAAARPDMPLARLIIQPTSMSRVVWRISVSDEPARMTLERQPRPV